jgi:hypothetical protein
MSAHCLHSCLRSHKKLRPTVYVQVMWTSPVRGLKHVFNTTYKNAVHVMQHVTGFAASVRNAICSIGDRVTRFAAQHRVRNAICSIGDRVTRFAASGNASFSIGYVTSAQNTVPISPSTPKRRSQHCPVRYEIEKTSFWDLSSYSKTFSLLRQISGEHLPSHKRGSIWRQG